MFRRVPILVHVIRLAVRAPKDVRSRWDRYWADSRGLGDGGDVLWDTGDTAEASRYLGLLAEHADPALPVVDLACGNGRFTRSLATRFPRVVGVDIAPHAVSLAQAEGGDFRVGDATDPALAAALHEELGDCTVFIRGLLHTLDAGAARRVGDAASTLVGRAGVVLIAETDYRGPLLGYLESLGAGPRGLPGPLARAVSSGIPRPHPFGDDELAAAFPPERWERVLVDHSATISAVPMRTEGVREAIPGHVAVLRPVHP
ncbi:hypothetical protein GCM10009836_45830 [Pseudonocardia ailaonensis]|uniref:Methyltransferase domain-containing protein n=1 Tax=Pseudonocardia ailaonensis TaxID=367279 RepID=A0ABN2NAI9_9PSEU